MLLGRLRLIAGTAVLLLLPLRAQAPQCDLNGDGVVDVRDVQIVLQAALGAPCAAIQQTRDVFPAVPGATAGGYVLSYPPASPPAMVFLNGLLQTPTDYTISGQTLAFTAADLGAAPVVQVVYWH